MSKNKYEKLEQKAIWRLIKVIYYIASGFIVFIMIGAGLQAISSCGSDGSTAPCSGGNMLLGLLIFTPVVAGTLALIYFGLRWAVYYVAYGSKTPAQH